MREVHPYLSRKNPCLGCGVCCTGFRVSFYWTEADDATPGGVPADLTERAPLPHMLMMKGTGGSAPRCVALEGIPGQTACCSIHPVRPSVCRAFAASYEDGDTPNERCDAARARAGLAPLRPEDWWDEAAQVVAILPAISEPDNTPRDRRPPLSPAA
jgi:uncharacterized protein